jgi:hypothetical protein
MAIQLNDLVKVADGDVVRLEMYAQGLKDAGIDAQIVGEQLGASFGTAIPGSIQLWVRHADADKAAAAIARMESERSQLPHDRPAFEHPKSERKRLAKSIHGSHTHYDADPRP